ncbi:MAG TPA: ribosome recycling factor [Candidatus Omnitrophica bacterium]|nr:MAG: ribosome recycling factor [Omnitrophica WOR_2 bacterium GWA2_63_20]OGX16170.1 MAG: ribosome recycling factor [Omnitrophica WOR_2 bacterium GWF2_63_9]OGX32099.1 MAG: ribosome recycling factor [Omnitrophica WOR_2 bacterium RIFCSPHIGHO2_12_FULL_64_13]OGX35149.1 MAG: ribosome recycling factor [Omnitrophica WOR_2 bacterium RIFCSPHIGHO2_02_FULL_63_39]OGX45567.1 MAG: ribosome recycling factor [Omnitrophica WOR_2 bacterium RIFCSPLOWO2_02_FULL_63_16]OGX48449.1 MAG: ribosome recycling factor [Om
MTTTATPQLQKLVKDTEDKMKKSLEAATRQLGEMRGGRANPTLVEHLTVSYYGAPTPLKQLAAITAPEPRMLVVQAWDAGVVLEIEKAILQSNLGISPQVDGKLIRLPIPPLTVERRQQLTKLLHQMAEEGRITVRTIRRDANEVVKKLKGEKQISEDDAFKTQDAIQKLTDRFIGQIDTLLKSKEHDLLTV